MTKFKFSSEKFDCKKLFHYLAQPANHSIIS